MMRIKNLMSLVVIFFFVFSCSKDTFEDQKVDDSNPRIAQDQFDNSYLGVYKGLFTTNDGLTRGKVVVTLLSTNEGIAQITLSTGEMIELKSNKVKLTLDNTVNDLRFSSEGLSNIDASLEFSVEEDGRNPVISNVNFDNKASDILIAKNLSRAPLTPITGTYVRTAGSGGFATTGLTWNVMAIGTGDQNFAVQISYGGRVFNTPAGDNMQSGCVPVSNLTTCNVDGTAQILGYDVTWSGTHTYASEANLECSSVVGTWSAPTFAGSSGTFVSDSDCNSPVIGNDTCATASIIALNGSSVGSTANATNSDTPDFCDAGLFGSADGKGVWYTFSSPTNVGLTVDTEGTAFDTQLRVFSGACDALVCMAADDDSGTGVLSSISFTATANVNYYFFVGGYNTAAGNYQINLTEVILPDNDLCMDSIAITCGESVTGSTESSTNTGAPTSTCNGISFNTAGGVWYSYTAPADKVVTMDTAGSDYDTKLAVYSGTCGALDCVTGNDDGAGLGGRSRVTFTAAAGATYYVYVTGFSSNTGNYVLNVACADPLPNDLCSSAISIECGGTATGTTVGASNTGAPSATCGTSLNTAPGVWYSFSTPVAKSVTVNTIGSTFDTKLGVFSGACNALVCIGGNDDGGTGISPQSQVIFGAAANTTYYFYVTAYSTNTGNYTLNVSSCDEPLPGGTFTTTPECSEYLVDNGTNGAGTPFNYGSNRNDTYSIDAGAGMKVSLPFTVFNTESTWDAMRIYNSSDGVTLDNEITSVNGRVIYNSVTNSRIGFSGTGTGPYSLEGQTVVSSGRYLVITFKSDGSFQYAGFLAQVNCIAARMGDDSHIKTSNTFMPMISADVAKQTVVTEADKLRAHNKMLQEAERKELRGRDAKVFKSEADRIQYYQKRKQ